MSQMRSCVKTGCRWPAAATLSYRYDTAEVWLSDLANDHPATHDLCPHHADDLRVPRGWDRVDDRTHVEAVHEPTAAEIVERNTQLRGTVDRMLQRAPSPEPSHRSRYAELLENLPMYRPSGAPASATGDDGDAVLTPDAPSEPPTADPDTMSVSLVPLDRVHVPVSHEMAPIVRGLSSSRGAPSHLHEDTTDGQREAIVLSLPLRNLNDSLVD